MPYDSFSYQQSPEEQAEPCRAGHERVSKYAYMDAAPIVLDNLLSGFEVVDYPDVLNKGEHERAKLESLTT